MEIICIFKCSSFCWASPSHQCSWWPCRSLAEEEWPGQRAGCSRAPGSAAAWLWTMSLRSPARTCISDPIYDLAEGFKPGCGLQQLKRHKWCSNWVENGHHLSSEPGDSTHCAFGDCGCDRKNRAGLRFWPLSWGRCCTQKYCILYYTPNMCIFLRQAGCISHNKLRCHPPAVTTHITQCGKLHFEGSKAYARDRKLSQM